MGGVVGSWAEDVEEDERRRREEDLQNGGGRSEGSVESEEDEREEEEEVNGKGKKGKGKGKKKAVEVAAKLVDVNQNQEPQSDGEDQLDSKDQESDGGGCTVATLRKSSRFLTAGQSSVSSTSSLSNKAFLSMKGVKASISKAKIGGEGNRGRTTSPILEKRK